MKCIISKSVLPVMGLGVKYETKEKYSLRNIMSSRTGVPEPYTADWMYWVCVCVCSNKKMLDKKLRYTSLLISMFAPSSLFLFRQPSAFPHKK